MCLFQPLGEWLEPPSGKAPDLCPPLGLATGEDQRNSPSQLLWLLTLRPQEAAPHFLCLGSVYEIGRWPQALEL